MKTEFSATIVMGAGNQYWVLATVVKNAEGGGPLIINHVRNYPLGCCTIPCTHYILFFSFTKLILKSTKSLAIAKFAKKIVRNIVMVVSVAILSFTLDVVLYH